MAKICKWFIVSGVVQGVFYRASTKQQADALGIKGYAKNLPDGTVEVQAVGEEDAVNKLHQWLHTGPQDSDVENVTMTKQASVANDELADFKVL